jgi:hypothetical protein
MNEVNSSIEKIPDSKAADVDIMQQTLGEFIEKKMFIIYHSYSSRYKY